MKVTSAMSSSLRSLANCLRSPIAFELFVARRKTKRSDIVSVLPVPAPAVTITSDVEGECTILYCLKLMPPAKSAASQIAMSSSSWICPSIIQLPFNTTFGTTAHSNRRLSTNASNSTVEKFVSTFSFVMRNTLIP